MQSSRPIFGFSAELLESPFLNEEIQFRATPVEELERPEETAEETYLDGEYDLEFTDESEREDAGLDDEEGESDYEDTEGDYEDTEVEFEEEFGAGLGAADQIDEAAAQPVFSKAVIDHVEPLLTLARTKEALKWNSARHPSISGVPVVTLLDRLARYVNRSALEIAMRSADGLKTLTGDEPTILALMAHQFQQKIYVEANQCDGKIGEGTLDALGLVRHRGSKLNEVDRQNIDFHVKKRTSAYTRVENAYKSDPRVFDSLGSDVSPKTWFSLFVNPPFLGWRIKQAGVHVELMRRLRRAETWLLAQPRYRDMNAVQLGAALGIDERHGGGRPKATSSMHTPGLAIDIGYVKNPWVAGLDGADASNAVFQDVTRRVARLVGGVDEALTPSWLADLSADTKRDTASAYDEIQQRHAWLLEYLRLEANASALKALIAQRQTGAHPEWVIARGQTIDAAVASWRRTIRDDRAALRKALQKGRDPAVGFLNLHRDLVVALREQGCLAWGAIDLEAGQSGDMMHFDSRPAGVGYALALDRQRTVKAGHPCVQTKQSTETEAEDWLPPIRFTVPPPYESHLGGRVWSFTAKTLPMRIGVFCPKPVNSPKSLDLLVFIHGHLSVCKPVPKTPEDLIKKEPFSLGRIVHNSKRDIAVAAPFMQWGGLKDSNLSLTLRGSKKMHQLGRPVNMNAVVAEILADIGRIYGSSPPSINKLILAGHSRAYDVFNPLVIERADAEMSRGALGALSEVWLLDTSYVCFKKDWTSWLTSSNAPTVTLFYKEDPKDDPESRSPTAECGRVFRKEIMPKTSNLVVKIASEGHCEIPATRLPALLSPVQKATELELEDEEEEPLGEELEDDDEYEDEEPEDEDFEQ